MNAPAPPTDADVLRPGQIAPDFSLPARDGRVFALSRLADRPLRVLVFGPPESAAVRAALPVLVELETRLAAWSPFAGAALVIDHEDADVPGGPSAASAVSVSVPGGYPCLRDAAQEVTRAYGVSRVGETVLVDDRGIIRYRGTAEGLAEAVSDLVAGNFVRNQIVPAAGPPVRWKTA